MWSSDTCLYSSWARAARCRPSRPFRRRRRAKYRGRYVKKRGFHGFLFGFSVHWALFGCVSTITTPRVRLEYVLTISAYLSASKSPLKMLTSDQKPRFVPPLRIRRAKLTQQQKARGYGIFGPLGYLHNCSNIRTLVSFDDLSMNVSPI